MNLVKQESVCTRLWFLPSYSVCLDVLTWEMSALARYHLRTTYGFHACRWEMPSYLCAAPAHGWRHTLCCQRDFALTLIVCLSLREGARGRSVCTETREAGHGARHLSPTPDLCRSCHRLPLGQRGGLVGTWPSAGMCCNRGAFLRISVYNVASSVKGECPLVSVKSIHHGNGCHEPSSSVSLCSWGQGEGMGPQISLTAVKPGFSLTFWGQLWNTQLMSFPGRDLQHGVRNTWQDLEPPQPSILVRTSHRHKVQDAT